ncbi:MAG: hypothetical protein HQM15_03185 [Deltaproteobacteria bacterium]|nr:hypothetical protein [Deltaproteobacteria bacterium]
MDAQIRQILEWSGEPVTALHAFEQLQELYLQYKGHALDLEPVNTKRMLSILGNSHFLTQFLLKNAAEIDLLTESNAIETEKKMEHFLEELSVLSETYSHNVDDFKLQLRNYKYREFLRITVKDLSQAAGQKIILEELSDLACALVQAALGFELKRLQEESPSFFKDEERWKPEHCGFQVIAMGKLGAREINYSSDIDLQYVYDLAPEEINPEPLGLREFYYKLAERLTQTLSSKSPEGFLYRVDLDLRPEGKSGPLVNSLYALENYYEAFGEEWERQALIRAIPIAGDEKLKKDFLSLVHPFVWRKHVDLSTIDRMKAMKAKVHESSRKKLARGFNVKLDEGGIREIEFFVQTLQLLFGGQQPSLQTPSTFEALKNLTQLKRISEQDESQLTDAYLFLRRVEHRLQLVHEAQTHNIPQNISEQMALARRMGYYDEDLEKAHARFMDDLTHTTSMVQNIFKNLFDQEMKVDGES